MSKIATKGRCNFIETGGINSGSFLGDLISECPTYKEIIGTDKFIVNGTYEDNQLVKESDITKYIGKTKNYSFIWGEWDMTKKAEQAVINYTYLNLRIRQNFLKAPDTNLKITIFLKIFYKSDLNLDAFSYIFKNLTVNFTQATGNDKKYAYTKDFAILFDNPTLAQIGSVSITNVLIETTDGTSQYEYVANIKDITHNYFVKAFSVTSSDFYINTYNDDTTNKIITNKCKIIPSFTIPTGTGINNIDMYIENQDFNYTVVQTNDISYNTTHNSMNYEFTAVDNYGERGYKLPYFYTKVSIKHIPTSYMSYVYALWNPASTQTGIELTNIITDE